MPAIWTCTVVHRDVARDAIPPGSDKPMRDAVENAYKIVTGVWPEGISSGWGQNYLPHAEEAALDMVPPDDRHYECWQIAKDLVDDVADGGYEDFTPMQRRYSTAVSALADLLYAQQS